MFVGDTELHNIISIDMHIVPGGTAKFEVGMVGEAAIDTLGDVQIKFDATSVKSAMIILKKQLENDAELRRAFVASVYSGIKDCGDKLCGYAMAEKIVSRLIGES